MMESLWEVITMNVTNEDSKFLSFVNRLKKLLYKITNKKHISIAVVVMRNKTVKVYEKYDGDPIALKRFYITKYATSVANYFTNCGIVEENEDNLPITFNIKPGSYIYWLSKEEFEKLK